MTKAVVSAVQSSLPAHLQGGKSAKFGNTDASDLIIPRVKLMQAISDEVTTFDDAKPGEFWHSVLNQSFGNKLTVVPVLMRKTFVLWAPRNDDRGILARASDAIHWDVPEGTQFTVKPKGRPEITYTLGKTVGNLGEFGSSDPTDPKSPPAAALTYEFMFISPTHPEVGPFVVINTRSAVKRGKDLLTKIDLRPVDHYGQQFIMGVSAEKGDEGPYNNYTYQMDGYADEATYNAAKAIYERYSKLEWVANDERDEGGDAASKGSHEPKGPSASKI